MICKFCAFNVFNGKNGYCWECYKKLINPTKANEYNLQLHRSIIKRMFDYNSNYEKT